MSAKARNAPGRKAAATEDASAALPAKRGRPRKTDAAEAAVEPPKKRGRPAKARDEESIVEEAPEPKRRRRQPNIAPEPTVEVSVGKKGKGRPKKEAASVQEEPPVTSRRGRPPKADIAAHVPPATPKRGRPTRTATLDLDRVIGSPRIGKRSSPRTKAKAAGPVARRLDPRVRSKLRTHLPPAKKTIQEKIVPKPVAKRGRPPKNAVPAPKQAAVANLSKPAKSPAPRKMRRHTVRQIPDRYVAQVDQYLHELIEAHASPAEEEHMEESVQEEDGIVAQDIAEDGRDVLVSSEQDREQYQEFSDDGAVDMNGQQDSVQDEEDVEPVIAQQDGEDNENQAEDVDGDELRQENNDIVDFSSEHGRNSNKDENAEPELQLEMSVHKHLEKEQDGHGNLHAEVDTEIVVLENSDEDGQEFFNGAEEDGLVSGTPGPPATAIFG